MAKVGLSEDGTKECDGPKAPSRPSRHQIYRVLVKARCDKLKKVKAELEDAIQRLEKEQRRARRPASLSWENVALALKDSSEESRRQNRDLRDKIQAFHQLVNDLAPWAALTRELDPTSTTWRDTSLPIHPESRRMAKTWITQRMIHNTDAMFQQHGFVSRDDQCVDVWCDVDVTVSDTGTLCKIRRNFISPQTLEQSVAFVRENWLEAILIEAPQDSVIHECDGNTKLGTVITSVGEYIHLLWAEFHQGPDRCTFVLRHIVDDDAQSPSAHLHQRSRNIWFDYTRLADGRTRKRVLSFVSNCHFSGELDLDAEASMTGLSLVDCPDHLKETRLRQHVVNLIHCRLRSRIDYPAAGYTLNKTMQDCHYSLAD